MVVRKVGDKLLLALEARQNVVLKAVVAAAIVVVEIAEDAPWW